MEQKGNQPLRALDLLSVEFPKDYCYIEQNILTKEGNLLLGGEAKTFKSFIMLEVARALSTGTNFMDHPNFIVPNSVKVLYIEQEVGWRANQERIKKIFEQDDPKIWGDNFYVVCKNLDLNFNDNLGIKNIISIIKEVKPNVVILDPISYLFHKDENSATEVGNLFFNLGKIKEMFKEQELSLVISHHFGKRPWGKASEGWDSLSEYNFRGSSKWKDGGDTLITTTKIDEYKKGKWKNKKRFLTRHGDSPAEVYTTFNDKDDLRIRVIEEKEEKLRLRKNEIKKEAPKISKIQEKLELANA